MVSIDLPDSLTYIGEESFRFCSSLVSINLPDSLTSIGKGAFESCTSIVSIDLPISLTSIGEGAFFGCSSLISINIPQLVAQIGDKAFAACRSLSAINVNIDNQYYISLNGVLFNKDLTALIQFPAGLNISEYSIPEQVNSIRRGAFYGCRNLITIDLPETLTSIEDSVFDSCSSLVSINLPDSLTYIGEDAFYFCSSLVSINLPDSLTSIGTQVFSNCSSLVSINLPDSLTYIGDFIFTYCSSLVSINLPDSLSSIGNMAFYNCLSLVSINFPNSLTSIGYWAFGRCESMVSIDFPDSLTSLGYCSFSKCQSLKEVICRASVIPELDNDYLGMGVFDEISKEAVLYVYESVLEDYENSDWAQYFSQILPIQDIMEVTSIKISPEGEQEMTEGATMVFTATVLPENATDATVVWSTDNEEVISIEVSDEDPNMVTVTALETGEATLTATAADGSGVTAQVSIVVKDPQAPVTPATKVEITGFYGSILYLGSSVTLSAIVSPEDATYKEVNWETSNPEVLTVDEEGYVSAVGLGTAKISVAVASDLTVSDSIEITVIEDSQSGIVEITPEAEGSYNVYSMAGNLVLSTKDSSKLKELEPGLYIINGKKVVIK